MEHSTLLLPLLCLFANFIIAARGHGLMLLPIPRQVVRNDNPYYGTGDPQSLAAGGPAKEREDGHGLCGDLAGRKIFMAPSEYGPQIPGAEAKYLSGQWFDVQVKVTAHHKGWFEFRLCVPVDGGADLSVPITQDCLNQHVLEFDVDHARAKYPAEVMPGSLQDPSEYDKLSEYIKCDYAPIHGSCCNDGGDCSGKNKRWVLPDPTPLIPDQIYEIRLKLPDGVSAQRAVLQWYWQTGNSPYSYTEAFWNCADIAILGQGTPHPTNPTPPITPSTPAPVPEVNPATSPELTPAPSPAGVPTPDITNDGNFLENVKAWLNDKEDSLNNNVLLYQLPSFHWVPSTIYKTADMIQAIDVMSTTGAGGLKFFVGSNNQAKAGYIYGLVNVAAFLAQSLQESIHYNACDENNWDMIGGKYPMSNACGQLGQSYQDYQCSAEEAHMACDVDINMEITAETNAKWWGAPDKLFCGPKSKYAFTGSWDPYAPCSGGVCDDYDGQKGGAVDNEMARNSNDRTDVEGCCWWGRGVIQTTGICNFGKLNYHLGKRAADEGRVSAYPAIDFCKTPDAICSSTDHPELKWIAGLFYWLNSVQTFDNGFNYLDALRTFTDKLSDSFDPNEDTSFIDAVSGIVNRGCPSLNCPAGEVHNVAERRENFKLILGYLGLTDNFVAAPTLPPVQTPTGGSGGSGGSGGGSGGSGGSGGGSPSVGPSGSGDCRGRDPQNNKFCESTTHDMCYYYPGTCKRVEKSNGSPSTSPAGAGSSESQVDPMIPMVAGIGLTLGFVAAGGILYRKRQKMKLDKKRWLEQKNAAQPLHYNYHISGKPVTSYEQYL